MKHFNSVTSNVQYIYVMQHVTRVRSTNAEIAIVTWIYCCCCFHHVQKPKLEQSILILKNKNNNILKQQQKNGGET